MKSLYSVYDKVAKEYAAPFMQNNDDSAVRAVLSWLRSDPKIQSEDYSLSCVGHFYVNSGTIVPDLKEVPFSLGGEE